MAFDISAFGVEKGSLPSGWAAERLDMLASLNPEQIRDDYPHSIIAYLDIANVTAGAVGKPITFLLADAPSRAKRIVRPNDTILSTVRPGNRAYAFLREVPENLIVSTGFAVLRAKAGAADPRFVYYIATSDPIINYLTSIAEEKTAYPSVNPDDIAECIVPIPPLPEQRAIAHILGTLDDKIELNRRLNETLEEMARAIFKSWFLDFEPVRAKAEGRWKRGQSLPGLPAHFYDIFPARLVDSALGEIPEGWEIRKLGDLMELAYGKALKAKDRYKGDVPVYGSNGQVGWHNERLVTGPGIIVGRKGNPGVVIWAPTDFFVIDTAFYVIPKAICNSLHFLFHLLQTHDLASLGADSAVPGLNRNIAYMNAQLLPSQQMLEKYEAYARSLAGRVYACGQQSQTLSALRDALLPKLVSGDVRVKDAERFLKAHGL